MFETNNGKAMNIATRLPAKYSCTENHFQLYAEKVKTLGETVERLAVAKDYIGKKIGGFVKTLETRRNRTR